MPLYAGELNIRRGAPLAEYPASLGEILRAQGEETRLNNPLQALIRLNDMSAAERGEVEGYMDLGPEAGQIPVYAPAARLDAETARARVKDEGLPLTIPEDGISERALDILIRRKREELQRQNVFSRGPTGFGPGAARLGVSFVESLMDPLNIASAFVPVVGPARYAALVAGAGSAWGRAGVRAGVGALEGAAGAALLEPIVYGANRAEQADYTMADSILNIAFGGLFGGGLHTVGGVVRDVVQPGWWKAGPGAETPDLRARNTDVVTGRQSAAATAAADTPEGRQVNLRTAVAQAAEGRRVDVEALRGAEREQIGGAYDRVLASPRGPVDDPVVRLRPEDIGEVLIERGPAKFEDKDGSLIVRPGGYGLLKIIWKHGEKSGAPEGTHVTREDVLRLPDILRDFAPIEDRPGSRGERYMEWQVERADGQRVLYALRKFTETDRKQHVVTVFVNDGKNKKIAGKPLSVARKPESPDGSSMLAAGDTGPGSFSVETPGGRGVGNPTPGVALDQARAAGVRNASPEAIRSAEPEGAEAAARTNAEAKPVDLTGAEEELAGVMDTLKGVPDAERLTKELAAQDAAIKRADDYAKALKAGAACGIA